MYHVTLCVCVCLTKQVEEMPKQRVKKDCNHKVNNTRKRKNKDNTNKELQRIWDDYCAKVDAVIKANEVDITGLDRKVLLRKLWDHAEPTTGYMIKVLLNDSLPDTNEFYIDEVMKIDSVIKSGYVDYAYGRLIKTYIFAESNTVDVTHYDDAWGEGSFRRIVNGMKRK